MSHVRSWLLGALVLLCTTSAEAVGPLRGRPAVGPSAAVSALLAKSQAALSARDFVGARRALEQAYRAAATPEILFLLGRIAEAEGRILDAHDLMRRYLIDPARAPDDAAVAEAQRIVKLSRPPSGQIVVLGDPGSLLFVDDLLVGSVPLAQALLVSPGEHRITLQLGARRLDTPVPVQAGRSFEVRFTSSSGAVLITLLPAVLWVSEQAGVAEEAQNPLADAAELAARAEQKTLLGAEAALARAPELAQCLRTTACEQKLARKNEVDYVLHSRVSYQAVPGAAAAPGSWQLSLSLWHADIATPAATHKAECARCTTEQAAAALKQATAKLLSQGLARAPSSFSVTSEPPAAQVLIGGVPVGVTPYKQTCWAGTYELQLASNGYASEHRTVELRDGQQEELAVTLIPAGPTTVADKPLPQKRTGRPVWRLATGGVLLGVGLVLDGFGVSAALQNHRCVDPLYNGDKLALCAAVYNTDVAQASLLTVGNVAVIAGVLLMAVPQPKH